MAVEMEALLQNLRNWGCDIEGASERFLGDMELYRDCLEMLVQDEAFEKMKQALRRGEAETAFEEAHALKGVLANLGLTPMYDMIVQIVEPLRIGDTTALLPFCEELLQARENLRRVLELE